MVNDKALRGVTVLELGMVMQVPLAGQMLGDYGADVIKVERPPPGDIIRDLDRVGTMAGTMSCYYAALGRNKRTLCLDIKRDEGRAALLRLIDQADVVIHNFRPGVMERLGLGYEQLRERNPRLIYAVSYSYGEKGPMARLPGQDMLAQSASGLIRHGVKDDERPRLSAVPTVDYTSAASLVQGILAALIERERSGLGQVVTTSLFDVAVAMQALEISSLEMYGYPTNWLKFSMIFETKDGWITVLTLFRDNPLRMLCKAFGVEDMSRDPDLASADLQVENLSRIYETFGQVVAQYTTDECLEKLSETDILCAPANDLASVLDHPQTEANGIIWRVPVPGHGSVRLAGNPVQLSRTPLGPNQGPTAIGGHSESVLQSFGFSPDEIKTLKEKGIVE